MYRTVSRVAHVPHIAHSAVMVPKGCETLFIILSPAGNAVNRQKQDKDINVLLHVAVCWYASALFLSAYLFVPFINNNDLQ